MSSEGIYVGLNGGVKQLSNELMGVPFGISNYILGKFLSEIWKPSPEYHKEDLVKAEKVVEDMVKKFNNENHSGGSACVATQNLLSVMGAGSVSKEERDVYFMNIKNDQIINTWKLLSKEDKE